MNFLETELCPNCKLNVPNRAKVCPHCHQSMPENHSLTYKVGLGAGVSWLIFMIWIVLTTPGEAPDGTWIFVVISSLGMGIIAMVAFNRIINWIK